MLPQLIYPKQDEKRRNISRKAGMKKAYNLENEIIMKLLKVNQQQLLGGGRLASAATAGPLRNDPSGHGGNKLQFYFPGLERPKEVVVMSPRGNPPASTAVPALPHISDGAQANAGAGLER